MNNSGSTRLAQYVNATMAGQHGHCRKAITDFVLALIGVQSGCQARLARFFDNHESALKRLSRFLHNERFGVAAFVLAHAAQVVARLPRSGPIRIAIDWTSEDTQHLLVASLLVGRRAVPLLWRAYDASLLKDHTHLFERQMLTLLITSVLTTVERGRLLITADRGFGDVETVDLLEGMKVAFVIRAKGNVKVEVDTQWRKLNTLRFRTNQRRRSWGRVRYCQRSPRRLWLTQARERDRSGQWGIWFLITNRSRRADTLTREYARRFGCEQGFRDAKRMLGFAEARIRDIRAWERMFTLVAIALVILVRIGGALLGNRAWLEDLLRRVRSRRRTRSELSLVRAVTELLDKEPALWDLLDHRRKLNLEAAL
jgi:hypothetical protein